ncbi:MAG: hypothetical protein AAF830_06960 [Pseudomonadota bacterium]
MKRAVISALCGAYGLLGVSHAASTTIDTINGFAFLSNGTANDFSMAAQQELADALGGFATLEEAEFHTGVFVRGVRISGTSVPVDPEVAFAITFANIFDFEIELEAEIRVVADKNQNGMIDNNQVTLFRDDDRLITNINLGPDASIDVGSRNGGSVVLNCSQVVDIGGFFPCMNFGFDGFTEGFFLNRLDVFFDKGSVDAFVFAQTFDDAFVALGAERLSETNFLTLGEFAPSQAVPIPGAAVLMGGVLAAFAGRRRVGR